MQNMSFDIPAEFSIFQAFFEENKQELMPLIKEQQKNGKTLFQSIVDVCHELGTTLPFPDKNKPIYLSIAIIGHFLLGQYKEVLKIPSITEDFQSAYFRFKAAWLLGDKSAQTLLSDIIPSLMELKKKNKETYEICNNVLSLEVSFISGNRVNILKHAKQFRKDLFEHSLINQYPLLAIQLAGELAYWEYRTGDPEFNGWLEIYKELTEAFNMDTKRLDCYTILGGLYRYKGYLEEAEEYYSRAMELSKRIGNIKAYAELIAKIADFEHTRGNFDKALELCMSIVNDKRFEKANTSIYINLGEILIKQQKYREAIKYLEQVEDENSQLSAVVNILHGYALTKTGDKDSYNKGIKLLEKGGTISYEISNRRFIAIYYYYRGRAHLDSYDLSSAIHNFEKCYTNAINTEFQYVLLSQIYLAVTYLQRFKVSQQDSDLTQSKHYLANVVTICKEQNLQILANVLILLGQVLTVLEEYVDAKIIFEEAKNEALKNSMTWSAEKAKRYIYVLNTQEKIKSQLVINEMSEIIESISKFSYTKTTEKLPELYLLLLYHENNLIFSKILKNEEDQYKIYQITDIIKAISTINNNDMIRSVDFESQTLIVEKNNNLTGVLLCEFDSFNARARLVEFLNRVIKIIPNKENLTEEDLLTLKQKVNNIASGMILIEASSVIKK